MSHGKSIEVRLKSNEPEDEKGPKCKFDLSIDIMRCGAHKFSFEYLVQELFSRDKNEKGMPLIEAELRMKLDSRLNNQYRKVNIIGRDIPSQAAYTCRGHSYSADKGEIRGLVKTCEGCKYYK
jgi:hypothetical protein